jgi:RNA polymerase sigma-70 factor, ECF subfamily
MKRTTAPLHNCERELISRAIEGDESAFTELFEFHKDHVYSLCLRMTANVPEAEDLMQEAFLQVFRKLATFRNESALSTWIYRITVNTTLMRLRKRNLHQESLDQWLLNKQINQELELSRHDSYLCGTVDRLALIRAISELPPGYRTIFLLHEVEGYGHHELARLLNCTVGNTRSQLHKARLRIREFLLNSKATREARVAFPVGPAVSEICPEAGRAIPYAPMSERKRSVGIGAADIASYGESGMHAGAGKLSEASTSQDFERRQIAVAEPEFWAAAV